MIRRSLVLVAATLVVGGSASQALASPTAGAVQDGQHSLCVLGSDGPNGPREGVCVWIPTK